MRPIGFCTGAVARGDFRRGLRLLAAHGTTAVEISAHRQEELADLVSFLATERPPAEFRHVSVHAPSGFDRDEEAALVRRLSQHIPPDWPIIMHPDLVRDDDAWRSLGARVCFENMDQAKPLGKSCDEMRAVFDRFPAASFCADIGHARQIDPSMQLATELLTIFRDRLREVHCSEVTPRGIHQRMSPATVTAFARLAPLIPPHVPIVLETDLPEEDIEVELHAARELFGTSK